MESALEAVNTAHESNLAEVIVAEELTLLKSSEKRQRLLGTRIELISGLGDDRIMPGGLLSTSSTVGIPPGMSPIIHTGHVFIRNGGIEFIQTFFDLHNRFELLNSEGQRIFFAGETLENFGEATNCFSPAGVTFDLSIVGCRGGGVMCVKANKAGVITVSDFRKILGTILDISGCCCYSNHTAYSVRDSNNFDIFKIRATMKDVNRDSDYEIFNRENLRIGYFSQHWAVEDIPEHASIPEVLFGVNFPFSLDPNEKILLIGVLFTLYFQHLHEGHPLNRNAKCIILGFFLVGLFTSGLIIGLIVWSLMR